MERGGRDLALIPHIATAQTEPLQPKYPFTIWVLTSVRMTVWEAGSGNLSPPPHLPLRSSAVSGMGGMSSVPCARERAELVRAWWVTASGSGVAICGDTGTKLDRPVPAGFETEPARDPGKSPRAGCLGHHHQTFKSDTRCPPCIPHPSHRSRRPAPWRVSCCFLPIPWGGGSPPSGETEGRRVSGVVSETSSTASRRFAPAPSTRG